MGGAPQQQEYDQYAVSSWYLPGTVPRAGSAKVSKAGRLEGEGGWRGGRRGWEKGHGADGLFLARTSQSVGGRNSSFTGPRHSVFGHEGLSRTGLGLCI